MANSQVKKGDGAKPQNPESPPSQMGDRIGKKNILEDPPFSNSAFLSPVSV